MYIHNLILNVFTTKIMKICISIATPVCLSVSLYVHGTVQTPFNGFT